MGYKYLAPTDGLKGCALIYGKGKVDIVDALATRQTDMMTFRYMFLESCLKNED